MVELLIDTVAFAGGLASIWMFIESRKASPLQDSVIEPESASKTDSRGIEEA